MNGERSAKRRMFASRAHNGILFQNKVKLLGPPIDSNLRFSGHIHHIFKKPNKAYYAISQTKPTEYYLILLYGERRLISITIKDKIVQNHADTYLLSIKSYPCHQFMY
nr:unnamed protein product [Callosobruchus analis]